jgi:hypothetical protein
MAVRRIVALSGRRSMNKLAGHALLGLGWVLALVATTSSAQTARIRVVPQSPAPATVRVPDSSAPGLARTQRMVRSSPVIVLASEAPPVTLSSGPVTALQIAQSFVTADRNRDGELTPDEAQQLTLGRGTFEDMDRNHDRILTRFEYEDAFR